MTKLKEQIFKLSLSEMDKYQLLNEQEHTPEELALQEARFAGVYSVVEECGLFEEYEAWRQTNRTTLEIKADEVAAAMERANNAAEGNE